MKPKGGNKPLEGLFLCPFCGGKILYEEKELHDIRRRGVHYVICATCKGRGGYGQDLNEAIQKWQLRVMSV